MPVPGWMASPTRSTKRTLRETSASCTEGSRMPSTGPNRCAESISPKKTGNRDRSRFPPLRDKLVQKVVGEILNAIYEQDFLDCAYGFRPGRGAHHALDEVGRVICTRPTEWILELDITSYFDTIVRKQLIEMIEKRISDDSVLRLIR